MNNVEEFLKNEMKVDLNPSAEYLNKVLSNFSIEEVLCSCPIKGEGENWLLLTKNSLYIGEESLPLNSIVSHECSKKLSLASFTVLGTEGLVLGRFDSALREVKPIASILQCIEEKRIPKVDLWSKHLIKTYEEEESISSKNKWKLLVRLLSYMHAYKKELTLGTIGALLLTLMTLVPSFLTGIIIDGTVDKVKAGTLTLMQAKLFALKAISFLALAYALKEFFAYFRLRFMSILGEKVASDLRSSLYQHMQKLSLSFFQKKPSGGLITRLTSDTDRLWDFIAFGIIEVSIAILQLLALGGVILYLNWKVGLLLLLPVPVLLFSIFKHGQQMHQHFVRAWKKWSKITELIGGVLPGMKVVKSFHREADEVKRFEARNKDALDSFEVIHHAWTKFWPSMMLALHGLTVALWLIAFPTVLEGVAGMKSDLSLGSFVSLLLYSTMFMQPIEVIGQVARMMNRALSSAGRVFEILDTPVEIQDSIDAICLNSLSGSIEFQNVSFSYDGGRRILKDISFQVSEGEFIGIVGASGSGKSTLISLLMRFYDSTEGNIFIDGIELKCLDSGDYRSKVGLVGQDPYLFAGSLLENIRYGKPEASLQEVIEASKAANAHEFILGFSEGYESHIGERGITLSGGERQRISIARALLMNPRILILDEATSAVDSQTEMKIQEAVDRLSKGRTVLAIAHRLSTLRMAQRLLVMDKGSLIEIGSHEELLGKVDSTYSKLFKAQQHMNQQLAV